MSPIETQESAACKTCEEAHQSESYKLILVTVMLVSLLISSCSPQLAAIPIMLAADEALASPVERARRQFKNKQYEAALDTIDRAADQSDPNVQSLRQEIKSKMRSESPLAFRLAQRQLKAGSYTEAGEDFAIALRGTLSSQERLAALNGRCVAFTAARDAELAYQACSEAAKEPGSQREEELSIRVRDFLAHWARELRTKHGRAVEVAVAQDRGSEARTHWHSYKELPGARQDLVQRWDKEIATVEQRNEEEAKRQEQIREAQREEMQRSARQRLLKRYDFVIRFNKDRFERWVESSTTVLGVRIFDRAEISGSELYLWLNSTEFFGPNLRLFADYSDAFVVWCKCSAVTYVGVDYSHLGGGKTFLTRFIFDAEMGRSAAR